MTGPDKYWSSRSPGMNKLIWSMIVVLQGLIALEHWSVSLIELYSNLRRLLLKSGNCVIPRCVNKGHKC